MGKIKHIIIICKFSFLICFASILHAQDPAFKYSHVYWFGDSMSSVRPAPDQTVKLLGFIPFKTINFPNQASSYKGRYSNGKVMCEYLSDYLIGFTYSHKFNYAIPGAETGNNNFLNRYLKTKSSSLPSTRVRGLQYQIDSFLKNKKIIQPTSDDLYVIWIGANNVLSLTLKSHGKFWADIESFSKDDLAKLTKTANAELNQSLNDIENHMIRLHKDVGANNFWLFQLAPVYEASLFQDVFKKIPKTKNILESYVEKFNQQQSLMVKGLVTEYGMDIITVPIFSFMKEIVREPSLYGFKSDLTPLVKTLPLYSPDTINTEEIKTANSLIFFDPLHLTTAAHKVLSKFTAKYILTNYTKKHFRPMSMNTYMIQNLSKEYK